MKKLTLLALLLCPAAHAQQHRLGIELGGTHLIRQDLIFSPNIHKSTSPLHIGLSWEKGDHSALLLRFSVLSASASAAFDFSHQGETQRSAPHSFLFGDLAYRKGWAFVDRPEIRILAGFQVGAKIQSLNYQYGRIGSFGYYFQSGVGPFLQASYRWKERNSLTVRASQSALAWIARSPYLVNDDEFIENISSHHTLTMLAELVADGELKNLFHYKDIEAEVNYRRSLSRRWDTGIAYRFGYINVENPRPLHSLQHSALLHLAYKI